MAVGAGADTGVGVYACPPPLETHELVVKL